MPLKVKSKLFKSVVKAITRSMDVKVMNHMVRVLIPSYNLHERMDIPVSQAIPNVDAAEQIVRDMRDMDYFPGFILQLITASEKGFHGRRYAIPHIKDILKCMQDQGLLYDHRNHTFIEDANINCSHNWGILRQGDLYPFTIMKMDFVDNSGAVRDNPKQIVNKCYSVLQDEIKEIVETHDGRLWLWEGDGGIAAFHYANKDHESVSAAMEIQHRLFVFNHFRNPLKSHANMRIALISRYTEYWSSKIDIRQSEFFKTSEKIESGETYPGSVTITEPIYSSLNRDLANLFSPLNKRIGDNLYSYSLKWDIPK